MSGNVSTHAFSKVGHPLRADLALRVHRMISHRFDAPLSTIDDELRLVEDLGADALDGLELLMLIEHEFDIDIADEDFQSARSVGEVVILVVDQVVHDSDL